MGIDMDLKKYGPRDMSNYYSNPEIQDRKHQQTSGENNPMYGKGYKVSNGNNGHATRYFYYKNKKFDSMKELIDYLNSNDIPITRSAVMRWVAQKGTNRLYNMYKDVWDNLTWEYKDENKIN